MGTGCCSSSGLPTLAVTRHAKNKNWKKKKKKEPVWQLAGQESFQSENKRTLLVSPKGFFWTSQKTLTGYKQGFCLSVVEPSPKRQQDYFSPYLGHGHVLFSWSDWQQYSLCLFPTTLYPFLVRSGWGITHFGKGRKEKADERNSDLSRFKIIFTSGNRNEGKEMPSSNINMKTQLLLEANWTYFWSS